MIRLILCLLLVAAAVAGEAAGARPAAGSNRPGACGEPPRLALSLGFEDPRGVFSSRGRSFRTLESRFASAYRLACRSGLPNPPLQVRQLFLKNAPDANTTSIYRDGDGGPVSGRMVIEHPFIGQGGRAGIPTVGELRSAILCSLNDSNALSGPAVDELECLVD